MTRDLHRFRDDVERALAAADPELFKTVARERVRRLPSFAPARIVVHPGDVAEEVDGVTPARGTLTLYWAPRGSRLLERIATAMTLGTAALVERDFKRLATRHEGRSVATVDEAVGSLLAAPAFFDVRCGGKTLATNLWIDKEAELGSLTLPYSGGRVDPAAFEVVAYLPERADPASAPQVVGVLRPPELSDLERRVLEAVPDGRTEMSFAPSGTVMATPGALVTVVVFVTINTAVTTCCNAFRDRLAEVSLPAERVRQLGAARSVAELLELRAEVIEEFAVQ